MWNKVKQFFNPKLNKRDEIADKTFSRFMEELYKGTVIEVPPLRGGAIRKLFIDKGRLKAEVCLEVQEAVQLLRDMSIAYANSSTELHQFELQRIGGLHAQQSVSTNVEV